jgi:hypothetical protein
MGPAVPQDFRRYSSDDYPFGYGRCHDSPSRDDRIALDIGHDDSAASDPRSGSYPDGAEHAVLFSNGPAEVVHAVRLTAARDVHARSNEDITLKMNLSEVATCADVHIVVKACFASGEYGSEADCCCRGAEVQSACEKCLPKVLASQTRHERKELRRALERPIRAEHTTANPKRHNTGEDSQKSSSPR